MDDKTNKTAREVAAPSWHGALVARGLVPERACWTPMAGGRTNQIWKVSSDGTDVICKLFHADAGSPLFPNDPKAEETTLRHLAGTGLAPKLIGSVNTDAGPCLTYRYVPRGWDPTPVEVVARGLRRLHAQRPPSGLRLIPQGDAELAQQTREILAQCRGEQARKLLDLAPDPLNMGSVDPCLVHGDAVVGNVIVAHHGAVFIDWQCPGLGDPCEDLAMFLSPAMQTLYGDGPLSAAERRDFLLAYGAAETTDRYERLAPFFHWRMAAHCAWKLDKGSLDYQVGLDQECAALKALQDPDGERHNRRTGRHINHIGQN